MNTKVLLREENKIVDVKIKDQQEPEIKDYIKQRWQKVITLIAEIMNVPAGLIMKISKDHMEIFLKSENEDNPYPDGGMDSLLHGLYCETVVGKDQYLHVDNSLEHVAWMDNPDVKLNMISYYGLPLKWSDGSVFGTICVLDNKTNQYEDKYRELLNTFKEMIEQDLMLVEEKEILEMESGKDFLTNIANRRAFLEAANIYLKNYKTSNKNFAIVMMDLDRFKQINDYHGHITGDRILRRFAEVVEGKVEDSWHFSRYGGDEFTLIINEEDESSIESFMGRLRKSLYEDDFLRKYDVDVSYGIAIIDDSYNDVDSLIEQADKELYKEKKMKH